MQANHLHGVLNSSEELGGLKDNRQKSPVKSGHVQGSTRGPYLHLGSTLAPGHTAGWFDAVWALKLLYFTLKSQQLTCVVILPESVSKFVKEWLRVKTPVSGAFEVSDLPFHSSIHSFVHSSIHSLRKCGGDNTFVPCLERNIICSSLKMWVSDHHYIIIPKTR